VETVPNINYVNGRIRRNYRRRLVDHPLRNVENCHYNIESVREQKHRNARFEEILEEYEAVYIGHVLSTPFFNIFINSAKCTKISPRLSSERFNSVILLYHFSFSFLQPPQRLRIEPPPRSELQHLY